MIRWRNVTRIAAAAPALPAAAPSHRPRLASLSTNPSTAGAAAADETPKPSLFARVLGPASVYARPDFPASQRWKVVLPAFATHVCIGTPWAWSVMATPLMLEMGGVVPAAADWSFAEVSAPMSILFFMMGTSAAALGKWQLKVGVRTSLAVASGLCACWCGFIS